MRRRLFVAIAALPVLLAAPDGVRAAEIVLVSPGAMRSSLTELVPRFEQSAGHKVTVAYSPALALADRIRNGQAADVAILGEPDADALAQAGRLVAGSKAVVATVGVGVFVRRGAPMPDIAGVEAFRRAIADARAIAYSDPALGQAVGQLAGQAPGLARHDRGHQGENQAHPAVAAARRPRGRGRRRFRPHPDHRGACRRPARARGSTPRTVAVLHPLCRKPGGKQRAAGRRQGADRVPRVAAGRRGHARTAPTLAPAVKGQLSGRLGIVAELDDHLANAKVPEADLAKVRDLRARIATLVAEKKIDQASDAQEEAMRILGYRKAFLRCGPGSYAWMKVG